MQGAPVARLFSASLGLVIKVPHCCYVLLSAPILPCCFGGNFKIKGGGLVQTAVHEVLLYLHCRGTKKIPQMAL